MFKTIARRSHALGVRLGRLIGRRTPAESAPEAAYLPDGYVGIGIEAYLARRSPTLLGPIDPTRSRGLEIGPLYAPIVSKAEGDILYVDFTTADVLRQNYTGTTIDPETIVDVDIVWDERPLRDCLPPGPPIDYVLAVHVIEHVPDFVGWLQDMHGVLRPDGMLGLIVPDRRHTFDIARQESSLGEVLEAYWLRRRRPSLRQVFEFRAYAVAVEPVHSWQTPPEDMDLSGAGSRELVAQAAALAESMREAPAYHDSHCWMFTPASFVALARDLARLHLFPFRIEFVQSTVLNWNEFILRLHKVETPDDPRIAESLEQARRTIEADPHEHIYAERMRRQRAARAGLAAGVP